MASRDITLIAFAWTSCVVACEAGPVCVPGETQECVCPMGAGAQSCGSAGERWLACECNTSNLDAGTSFLDSGAPSDVADGSSVSPAVGGRGQFTIEIGPQGLGVSGALYHEVDPACMQDVRGIGDCVASVSMCDVPPEAFADGGDLTLRYGGGTITATWPGFGMYHVASNELVADGQWLELELAGGEAPAFVWTTSAPRTAIVTAPSPGLSSASATRPLVIEWATYTDVDARVLVTAYVVEFTTGDWLGSAVRCMTSPEAGIVAIAPSLLDAVRPEVPGGVEPPVIALEISVDSLRSEARDVAGTTGTWSYDLVARQSARVASDPDETYSSLVRLE